VRRPRASALAPASRGGRPHQRPETPQLTLLLTKQERR
jgi:hypothetical protein